MISLVVYDFDGVMTNNQVLVMEDGREAVFCNRDDGWAIKKIKELKIPQLILSTEKNPVVVFRASKLSIPAITNCQDKKKYLLSFCKKEGYELRHVLFVGNSLNDLEVMRAVGQSMAVHDAHPQVIRLAGFVTQRKGGEGVVMEVLKYLQERVL